MNTLTTSVEIGCKIKDLRVQAKLTQERLAEMVGLSFKQVQKYESGVNTMNTDKLQLFANALSVPVSAFFKDQPVETIPFSEEEKKLVTCFRKIKDPRVKDSILILANLGSST